ncbi:MAG: zf-HC2 domain-containing protein, partial [Candidatus Sericytochromatia bacterium]|nr:zf-HC2 domain-containing protein [Candidatus Sericytochromatia bacterium]
MCLDYIKINEYVDDVLSLTEKLLFKEHIQSCHKCMVAYKNLKNLVTTVNNLNYPVISDNFIDNLLLKIDIIAHPSFTDLSNYRDGFSKDDIYYQTEEHVEDCYQCQTIINSINNSINSVVSLNEYQPSENFFDNLMAKIDTLDMLDTDNNFDDSFLSGIMAKIEDLPKTDESKDFDSIKINHITSEDLSAYLDNEETIISIVEIKAHLSSCAKCESKYLSFKKS